MFLFDRMWTRLAAGLVGVGSSEMGLEICKISVFYIEQDGSFVGQNVDWRSRQNRSHIRRSAVTDTSKLKIGVLASLHGNKSHNEEKYPVHRFRATSFMDQLNS